MIRKLMIAFAAMALMGSVACSGGDKKTDEAPAEQPESAPMEEEAAEEAPAEEAAEEEAAEEGADEEAPAEEGGEEGAE